MTEVFIAALSTTKLEMNDEDLEFYRDEKAKEIQEVRLALEQLHQFGLLHKKERALANHSQIWRSLLILSKILGFESQFALIDQLRIPQSILTQQLWVLADIFILKHYYPRSTIGTCETTAQKYYVLMEGIVEKEIVRTSISKFDNTQSLELSGCRMGNSKFKKQNRKRFGRTDEQIPICLNSKRSQGRNIETVPAHFRSLTDVSMFQVSAACWKRYVSDFKRLQEEYLMNFIRKKMNLSLNFDTKDKSKTNWKDSKKEEQGLQDSFYRIVTLERKSTLQFTQGEILLLYMGEMLVSTPHYKVETSRGCVLNPAIYQVFTQRKPYTGIAGIATAKNLSTIIKISIHKLQVYFQDHYQERSTIIHLLTGLENNRKIKNEEQKMGFSVQMPEALPNRCRAPNIVQKLADESGRSASLNKIWQQSSKGKGAKNRIIGLKSIENMVEKTVKAAELKHVQYLKKTHFSQDNHIKYGEQNATIPFFIFKDCMKNIQNKNETLKQAIRVQKQKFKNQLQGGKRLLNECRLENTPSKLKMVPLTDSSIYLRKKIKDIYVKTEGSEEILNFATSSERQTVVRPPSNPTRQTVGPSMVLQHLNDKDFDSVFGSFGRGVMKKVQTGKIRRINIK